MTNRGGLAEAYKEVIHEDSLIIEGQTKAPDYVFRSRGALVKNASIAQAPSPVPPEPVLLASDA